MCEPEAFKITGELRKRRSASLSVVLGQKFVVGPVELIEHLPPVGAEGGFERCCNAQAAAAAGSMLVATVEATQAASGKQQLEPVIAGLTAPWQWLSKRANVEACASASITPLIAGGQEKHHPSFGERFAAAAPPEPENPTPAEAM
jgi:hypothetical protein